MWQVAIAHLRPFFHVYDKKIIMSPLTFLTTDLKRIENVPTFEAYT